MDRLMQGCTEISGPGSDWCPGVTPPDILAATGGGDITGLILVAGIVALAGAVVAVVNRVMNGRWFG